MRIYQSGSWSNIISITAGADEPAHFMDVQIDHSGGMDRLLFLTGKQFESDAIDPVSLSLSTNWIMNTGSSPLAIIPFNDRITGKRNYWCKLWFQDFRRYDAETGAASEMQHFWEGTGLGDPEFISTDPRVVFLLDTGKLQIALKSDLYPVFDPRILDFKVEKAVLNSDASILYLLSGDNLYAMKLPPAEERGQSDI